MTPAAVGAVRPRWYYGWNIVAVCVVSQVAALGVTLNCFSLFLRGWQHDFSTPISVLQLSTTIFALGCSVVTPFVGLAIDRYPARWVFGLALVALAAVHLAVGFATAAWQIIALYSLVLPLAIGFSATTPAQAVVSRWFVRRAGFAMGLTAFGLAAAGVVFPLIVVRLLPLLGWRAVWQLFAAVIVVLVIPIVVGGLRDRPRPQDGLGYVGAGPVTEAVSSIRFREIFRRRNFWVLVGVFVPCQCCAIGVSYNLAPLVTSHGFSAATAAGAISLYSVASLVAKLASGVLSDRLGNKVPLVLTPLTVAAGMGVLAFGAGQLPLLLLGLVMLGAAGGAWTLLASSTASEFGSHSFGRAYGLISAFTPIGSIAPPIVARTQELSGSYVGALVGLAVLAVIGAGVALLWKERPSRFTAAAPS